MHVGLNLVFLTPGQQGGLETYARELIPALVAAAPDVRFTAFINQDAATVPGPWSELTRAVTVPVQASRRVEWVRGEQQLLPPLARRAGIVLLHSLASTAPVWGPFRRVVTIHDLIYKQIPQAHPGLRALGMRVLVPLAASRSHRIIAVSDSTAADLRQYLGIDPSKIDIVPSGGGSTQRARPMPAGQWRARLGIGERPIVLSVSAKLVHKNLIRLIKALALIPAESRPVLVLPGYPTAHEEELRACVRETKLDDSVRLLGWISAEELEGLYGAAACCVLPSLAEGFGLPVLEAMARGVPVACSDRGALAEVAGNAALLFDPKSESAIAAALIRLVSDHGLADRLGAAGRERARSFSWESAATGTLASYRRALGVAASS